MARDILTRLRFSRGQMEQVEALVANHMKFKDAPNMKESTLKRFLRLPEFDEHLELHRLDCLASHGDMENYDYLLAFRKQMEAEPVLPPPWVDGWDIMELGVPEGREVGAWRQKAYDAQLEGTFSDRAALVEWLRGEIARQAPGGRTEPARTMQTSSSKP